MDEPRLLPFDLLCYSRVCDAINILSFHRMFSTRIFEAPPMISLDFETQVRYLVHVIQGGHTWRTCSGNARHTMQSRVINVCMHRCLNSHVMDDWKAHVKLYDVSHLWASLRRVSCIVWRQSAGPWLSFSCLSFADFVSRHSIRSICSTSSCVLNFVRVFLWLCVCVYVCACVCVCVCVRMCV